MYRFNQAGAEGIADPKEVIAKINEEKQKRLERAEKFGIETKEMD